MQVRIGLQLPNVGEVASSEGLTSTARAAEASGLASVWVSDHVVVPQRAESPYPYSRDGGLPFTHDVRWLEAIATLSYIAAKTEHVGLGISVLILPLRNTLVIAKQLATLAVLAPGRLTVGVGVGWLREEFEALGAPFASRGDLLDEQLAAISRLWSVSPASYNGTHVSFDDLFAEPRPSPRPAVWVGGTAAPALRRAGIYADAWHAVSTLDADTMTESMDAVRQAARTAGRDPDRVELTCRVGARIGAEGVESLARRLEVLAKCGCTHSVVDPLANSLEEVLDFVNDLAPIAQRMSKT